MNWLILSFTTLQRHLRQETSVNEAGDDLDLAANRIEAQFTSTNQNFALMQVSFTHKSGYFISPTIYPADELAHPELHNAAAELRNASISAVPEPASLAIWSLGALGCAIAGYRRRKL